jgi:hypothetical protein
MEKNDTADLLLGMLREQLKEVDYLVRYLSSLSSGTDIEPELEEWSNRLVDKLDREDLR